jgi:hypothetical protein
MRNKITVDWIGDVTVEKDDAFGDRIKTTYSVPPNGGYVRIRAEYFMGDDGVFVERRSNEYPQVFEFINGEGHALEATTETLPAVIRGWLKRKNQREKRN